MYMYIYLIYTLILEMCAYTQRKQICAYKFSIDKLRDIHRCTNWLELQAHVYMHTYTNTHVCSCKSDWVRCLRPWTNLNHEMLCAGLPVHRCLEDEGHQAWQGDWFASPSQLWQVGGRRWAIAVHGEKGQGAGWAVEGWTFQEAAKDLRNGK